MSKKNFIKTSDKEIWLLLKKDLKKEINGYFLMIKILNFLTMTRIIWNLQIRCIFDI